jgi:hypothetical protein
MLLILERHTQCPILGQPFWPTPMFRSPPCVHATPSASPRAKLTPSPLAFTQATAEIDGKPLPPSQVAPHRPPPPGPPRSLPPRSSRTTDLSLRISHAPAIDPPKACKPLPPPRAVARTAHLSPLNSSDPRIRFIWKLIFVSICGFVLCCLRRHLYQITPKRKVVASYQNLSPCTHIVHSLPAL